MKIATFIRDLQDMIKKGEITGEEVLVTSSDSEGNSFSPIDNAISYEDTYYIPQTEYYGELWSKAEWATLEPTENFPQNAQKAICLWPTN
jgi:hypothetical protein